MTHPSRKEWERTRPSRADRADVDDRTLRESEEEWPTGTDRLMVALEALGWLQRHGVRITRALRERVDEELIEQHGALYLPLFDVNTRETREQWVAPHAFTNTRSDGKGPFCDTCWKRAEHALHQPRPCPCCGRAHGTPTSPEGTQP